MAVDAGTVLGQLPKAGEWQGARRLGGGLAGRGSRGHRRDSQTQATCRHSEPVRLQSCLPCGMRRGRELGNPEQELLQNHCP